MWKCEASNAWVLVRGGELVLAEGRVERVEESGGRVERVRVVGDADRHGRQAAARQGSSTLTAVSAVSDGLALSIASGFEERSCHPGFETLPCDKYGATDNLGQF